MHNNTAATFLLSYPQLFHQRTPNQPFDAISRSSGLTRRKSHQNLLLLDPDQLKSSTMAREGTRSATGNSRPRVFPTVTETPATTTKKRATANTGAKRGPKTTTTKAAKPTGVTKKKAVPAKKTSVADKVEGVIKKAEGAVAKSPAKKAAGTKKTKGTDGPKKTTTAAKKK